MGKSNPVLNLDDVFGQSRKLSIKWQGKEYEAFPPEALSSVQLMRWERLAGKVRNMSRSDKVEVDEKAAAAIEQTVDQAVSIIVPDLEVGAVPFMAKVQIISWYIEQVSPDSKENGDDDSPNSDGGQTTPD